MFIQLFVSELSSLSPVMLWIQTARDAMRLHFYVYGTIPVIDLVSNSSNLVTCNLSIFLVCDADAMFHHCMARCHGVYNNILLLVLPITCNEWHCRLKCYSIFVIHLSVVLIVFVFYCQVLPKRMEKWFAFTLF